MSLPLKFPAFPYRGELLSGDEVSHLTALP